jgi:hypothetical protein
VKNSHTTEVFIHQNTGGQDFKKLRAATPSTYFPARGKLFLNSYPTSTSNNLLTSLPEEFAWRGSFHGFIMNNIPPGFERDQREHRERVERERERDIDDRRRQQESLQQQHELLAQRERENNERQDRQEQERRHRDHYQPAPPHQNDTASIPLHQPVASRLSGAIHSPGGLLANHGGAPPPGPLGAPSGPGNAFGGPLHSETNRPTQHSVSNIAQIPTFGPNLLQHNPAANVPPGPSQGGPSGFGAPLMLPQQQQAAQQAQQQQQALQGLPFGAHIPQAHQMPGASALGQGGQQPILNVSHIFSSVSGDSTIPHARFISLHKSYMKASGNYPTQHLLY